MIAEFEARLAEVLGGRLPDPFTGRVAAAPANLPGPAPTLAVGIRHAERAPADLGSGRRPETVPGADDPRRVVRLRCTVAVDVRPGAGEGRRQQVQGVDAALYVLDAPELRDGSALAGPEDPGFLIQTLEVVGADLPLAPSDPDSPSFGLTLDADGWFWPVGAAPSPGVPIPEIRLRGGLLPVTVRGPARVLAGGDPVELTILVESRGGHRITEEGVEGMPFGRLAVALRGAGGRPPAGTLSGGDAGTDGVRLLPPEDATVTYGPPDEAVVDELVIALDDGEGGLGTVLARHPVRVETP